MIKLFSKIIFKLFNFLDKILKFFFDRSFLIWFMEFINYEKQFQGLNFFVPNPIIDWRVKTMYKKEPETINWINGFKDNSLFWDIGANIGLYSLYCAKTHSNIKTISFEPSTSNLRVLSRNIFLNNFQEKIRIFQLPLSDLDFDFSFMNESGFSEGGSCNSFGVDYDYQGFEINTKNKYQLIGTSIDFLTKNNFLQIPNYIKIDVDGIEHLILKGAKETLKSKNIKEILIELNEDFKEQFEKCIDLLSKSGFKTKNKHKQISPSNSNSNMFNYIFERSN